MSEFIVPAVMLLPVSFLLVFMTKNANATQYFILEVMQ